MPIQLGDLMPSYARFLESFRAVKICPGRIEAPPEALSFNTLTLAVALVIFVLARSVTTADNDAIAPQIVAMVISALITFLCGYTALIVAPADGPALSGKWSDFFVHVWLGSLIAMIVLDGIPVWMERDRLSTIVIDAVVTPAALSELQKDAIRAVIFTLIALSLLLLKTKRQDPQFRLSCACWIVAGALGLIMNTALLLAFVYGNLL
jgi:hypothetical protein